MLINILFLFSLFFFFFWAFSGSQIDDSPRLVFFRFGQRSKYQKRWPVTSIDSLLSSLIHGDDELLQIIIIKRLRGAIYSRMFGLFLICWKKREPWSCESSEEKDLTIFPKFLKHPWSTIFDSFSPCKWILIEWWILKLWW